MGRNRSWENKEYGKLKVGDLVMTNYRAKMYAVVTKIEQRWSKKAPNGYHHDYHSTPVPGSERIGDYVEFRKVANIDFSPIRNYTGALDEAWLIKIDLHYFDNLRSIVNDLEKIASNGKVL